MTIERNNLLSQLAEKDESIAVLSDRVAIAEGESRGLAAEILRQGQTWERRVEAERAQFAHQIAIQDREFAHQIAIKDNQLALKESQLERKARELQTLTSTLGWRLLSLYGPIKYRLVLPTYRSLRSLFKALLRGEYHPRVVPLNNIRPTDHNGEWESTAPDPQFDVRGPWPTGLTKVSIEIETEGAGEDKVRLYIDRGEGYTEALSYDLGETNRKQEQYISIDPNVMGIRLDPLESAARFKFGEFVLTRVPGSKATRNNGAEPRADPISPSSSILRSTECIASVKRTDDGLGSQTFPAPCGGRSARGLIMSAHALSRTAPQAIPSRSRSRDLSSHTKPGSK